MIWEWNSFSYQGMDMSVCLYLGDIHQLSEEQVIIQMRLRDEAHCEVYHTRNQRAKEE